MIGLETLFSFFGVSSPGPIARKLAEEIAFKCCLYILGLSVVQSDYFVLTCVVACLVDVAVR